MGEDTEQEGTNHNHWHKSHRRHTTEHRGQAQRDTHCVISFTLYPPYTVRSQNGSRPLELGSDQRMRQERVGVEVMLCLSVQRLAMRAS